MIAEKPFRASAIIFVNKTFRMAVSAVMTRLTSAFINFIITIDPVPTWRAFAVISAYFIVANIDVNVWVARVGFTFVDVDFASFTCEAVEALAGPFRVVRVFWQAKACHGARKRVAG